MTFTLLQYLVCLVFTLGAGFNILMLVLGSSLVNKEIEATEQSVFAEMPLGEVRRQLLSSYAWQVCFSVALATMAVHHGWYWMGETLFGYCVILAFKFRSLTMNPHKL